MGFWVSQWRSSIRHKFETDHENLNLREVRELFMMRKRAAKTNSKSLKALHLMKRFKTEDEKANQTGEKRMAYLIKRNKELEAERDLILKAHKEKHYGEHYAYWKDRYLFNLHDPNSLQKEDPVWTSLIHYDNRLKMQYKPTNEETNVDRLRSAKIKRAKNSLNIQELGFNTKTHKTKH